MQRIDFEHEISQSGYAGCLILRKAKQLAAYPGFSRSDVDDIRQELQMQLFCSMSKFDAEKGDWRAFVKATVERNVASIIERQGAAKRGNGDTPISLSTVVHLHLPVQHFRIQVVPGPRRANDRPSLGS